MGSIPGLLDSDYGRVAMLKLGLFLALLALAGVNRMLFAPALRGRSPDRSTRWLKSGLAMEAVVGLAAVLAAGALASLAPGIQE